MPAALQPHTIDVLTNTPVTLRVLLEALRQPQGRRRHPKAKCGL